MITFNKFKIYNSTTYEVENKVIFSHLNENFKIDSEGNEFIISIGKEVNYGIYSKLIFEGDYVKVRYKDINNKSEEDCEIEGYIEFIDNGFVVVNHRFEIFYKLEEDNLLEIELLSNIYKEKSKLYKIKSLFNEFFEGSNEIFNINEKLYEIPVLSIESNNILFSYYIYEEKLSYTIKNIDLIIGNINSFSSIVYKAMSNYLKNGIKNILED